jgi:UDP-N-acetylglucosamine 4,6-dehydratase
VRYGNVIGSRGSVIPYFLQLKNDGATTLPITDAKMTRFWLTLEQAVELVFEAISTEYLGVFIPDIKAMCMLDLADTIMPASPLNEVGIRAGEKLHEALNSEGQEVYIVSGDNIYSTKAEIKSDSTNKYTKEEMSCLIAS